MRRFLVLAAMAGAAWACGCGPTRAAGDRAAGDRAAFDAAFAAFQAGQWQRAADGFTQYLRSSPPAATRAEVYYYRGQALVHLRRRDDARIDFMRAIGGGAEQPVRNYARVALGNLYYEEGNDAKAIEWYALAIGEPAADLPMDMLALRLAVSLQRLGRWPAAERYLRYVLDNFPDSAAAAEARRRSGAGAFAVQTGAYATAAAAQQEAARLRAAGFEPRIVQTGRNGQALSGVRVGRAATYAEAQTLAQRLLSAGFSALVVP
ncbi:MAG: tetratricopeptide repeat protein [Planctomycetes bacterium]|nr:tetratricopeptide repeat protein [Planctomycetota bacterium]